MAAVFCTIVMAGVAIEQRNGGPVFGEQFYVWTMGGHSEDYYVARQGLAMATVERCGFDRQFFVKRVIDCEAAYNVSPRHLRARYPWMNVAVAKVLGRHSAPERPILSRRRKATPRNSPPVVFNRTIIAAPRRTPGIAHSPRPTVRPQAPAPTRTPSPAPTPTMTPTPRPTPSATPLNRSALQHQRSAQSPPNVHIPASDMGPALPIYGNSTTSPAPVRTPGAQPTCPPGWC